MKTLLHKYPAEIVVLIALAVFWWTRDPQSPWDRIIRSDAKGYYAYLPATIIYQDPTYAFEYHYQSKYYPDGWQNRNYFKHQVRRRYVNKYFPGVAICLLPFFLLAHALSHAFGFDPDGYSLLYQLSVAVGGLFYLWLGLRWLRRLLLRFHVRPGPAGWTILLLGLGTNLFFYSVYQPGFSHVYSFALIAGLLWFFSRLCDEPKADHLSVIVGLIAMIILLRPVNGLIVLILPMVAGGWKPFWSVVGKIFQHRSQLLSSLSLGLGLLLIPPLLWHWQTGQWLVYTYAGEGFDFSNPHPYEFLFSFRKGWLLYTPMALIAMGGLAVLFKRSIFQGINVLIVFGAIVFVLSSWSSWWYGGSFGQRPMVDFYAVIGLLLALALTAQFGWRKYFTWTFLIAFLVLNQFQTWQYRNFILPNDNVTADQYAALFGETALKRTSGIDPKDIAKTHRVGGEEVRSEGRPSGEEMDGWVIAELGSIVSQYQALDVNLTLSSCAFSNDARLVVDALKEGQPQKWQQHDLSPYITLLGNREVCFDAELPEGTDSLRIWLHSPSKSGCINISDGELSLYRLKE